MAEVKITATGETVTAKLQPGALDLNSNALRMLSLGEEADSFLDRFDEVATSSDAAARLEAALRFVAEEGICRPTGLDPHALVGITSGLQIHNTQMFFARSSGQEAMSRALLEDLGRLGNESPDAFRRHRCVVRSSGASVVVVG